jgi:DNA-binding transcriptional LysR family regulator
MIELRNLETFVWIAHLGSFRAAADRLNTTQPAVSQRISQLEQALGARLFEREPRGVELTAKGRELLPLAERMLQLRLDMVELARDGGGMRGVVRLGVSETLVHTWLAELIERLHADHPALTLEIEVDTSPQLRERLMSRQLDLAFLLGPIDEPRIRNLPLSSYPMAWVAHPRLDPGPGPVSLAALARWPIITYSRNTRPHVAVREMMVRAGVTDLRMYGNASLSTIVRMTLDGIGISAIPSVIITRELAEGRLTLLQVEQPLPDLDFTASFPVNPDSLLAARLVEVALQVARSEASRRQLKPDDSLPADPA